MLASEAVITAGQLQVMYLLQDHVYILKKNVMRNSRCQFTAMNYYMYEDENVRNVFCLSQYVP